MNEEMFKQIKKQLKEIKDRELNKRAIEYLIEYLNTDIFNN